MKFKFGYLYVRVPTLSYFCTYVTRPALRCWKYSVMFSLDFFIFVPDTPALWATEYISWQNLFHTETKAQKLKYGFNTLLVITFWNCLYIHIAYS